LKNQPHVEMSPSFQISEIRTKMLEGLVVFLTRVRELEGIQRIALVGSICTEKENPKDIDLLLTIEDDVDLAPLAKITRQLSGHCQQRGRNGEVFLADPRGNYLGRICHWKECGPGIRKSCDALHCGARHYLHDDFATVIFKPELIHQPPIELWPKIILRVPVPADVMEMIIAPLQKA